MAIIEGLVDQRCAPAHLPMDNGPELVTWALREWVPPGRHRPHHHSGAANRPTEGLNLLVKKVSAYAVTASATSRTTGYGFYFTMAGSAGRTDYRHLVCDPALPTRTRRPRKWSWH